MDIPALMAQAERLYSPDEVASAADRWAAEIAAALGDEQPVVLACMVGGCIPLGLLLARLHGPLEVDYVHATRYRGGLSGAEVTWLHRPTIDLHGRTVIVVDDLLDEGKTLAAILDDLAELEPKRIYSAVLVTKDVPDRPGLRVADFSALTAPNRWLFGYGMDYCGWLRNAPGIYALP